MENSLGSIIRNIFSIQTVNGKLVLIVCVIMLSQLEVQYQNTFYEIRQSNFLLQEQINFSYNNFHQELKQRELVIQDLDSKLKLAQIENGSLM